MLSLERWSTSDGDGLVVSLQIMTQNKPFKDLTVWQFIAFELRQHMTV